MKPKYVKVYAPASISNVGPGFDVLGVAIDKPGDIACAERTNEPGLHFSSNLSANNVAAHVAQLMLDEFKPPFGVSLRLDKQMPIGSGLGSSGASCAAAVVAVNRLLPKPLSKLELVRFAIEGERLASGSPHADNVAPSILGGICLIQCNAPLEIIQLPYDHSLYWVVVHPDIVVLTKIARALLPKTIPIHDAIEQASHLSSLIIGLKNGDHALITSSLIDKIAEPVRKKLIPHYDDIKHGALNDGALGFSISGSGPSVFAITPDINIASIVAANIQNNFMKLSNTPSQAYISRVNAIGADILEEST